MSDSVTVKVGEWQNATRDERDVIEEDLRKHVLGEKFGEILSCRVMLNYAYIELSDKENALKAIKELTGVTFRKRLLWAKSKEEKEEEADISPRSPRTSDKTLKSAIKIHIGGLDVVRSERSNMCRLVRAKFEEHGTVVECCVFDSYGFVHMTDKEEGRLAIKALDNMCIRPNDNHLSIHEARVRFVPDINPERPVKLHVTGLRSTTGQSVVEIQKELRIIFEKFGAVGECSVLGTFAFVHMTRGIDGTTALRALDGTLFLNSLISVQVSKTIGGGGKAGPRVSRRRNNSPSRPDGFHHGGNNRTSPRDRRSPPWGRRSPPRGRRSPPWDRRSPPRGRRSPPRGRRSSPRGRRSPPRGRRSPSRDRRGRSRSPMYRREDRPFHHDDRRETNPRSAALPEKSHVVYYDVEGNPIPASRVRAVRVPDNDMAGARPAVSRAGVARTAEAPIYAAAPSIYPVADSFHPESLSSYDHEAVYGQQYEAGYYGESYSEEMHSGGLAYAQDMYAAPGNGVSHMQPAARRLVRAVGPRVVKAVAVPRKAVAISYAPSEYEEQYDAVSIAGRVAPFVGCGRTIPMVGRGRAAALPGRVTPLVGCATPMVGRGRAAPPPGRIASMAGRGRSAAMAGRGRAAPLPGRVATMAGRGRAAAMAGWPSVMDGQAAASDGQEGLAYDDSWQYDDPQQHYADPTGGYY